MKRYVLLWLMFLGVYAARGQDGSLDPTFKGKGWTALNFLTQGNVFYDDIRQMLVQPDGKYIALFESGNILLARFKTNGTLDSSYGTNGFSDAININAYKALLQPDGKVVVAGELYNPESSQVEFALGRYNSNGTLDATFGNGGMALNGFTNYTWANADALALQGDGKILAVGHAEYYDGTYTHYAFAVARYTSTGVLDATFNAGGDLPGTATFDVGTTWGGANAVALQSDGKIVVSGQSFDPTTHKGVITLLRLLNDGTSDGTVDESFGTAGWVKTTYADHVFPTNMVLQGDDKIVVAGYAYVRNEGTGISSPDIMVGRYLSDGTLDINFNAGGALPGIATTDLGNDEYLYGLALGPSSIVAAGFRAVSDGAGGWINDMVVARYLNDGTSDGTLDADFNAGGAVPGVVVYHPDDNNTRLFSVAVLSGGSIVGAGEIKNNSTENNDGLLARFTSSGALDETFNPSGAVPGISLSYYSPGSWSTIYDMAVQPDGKVVVAGEGKKYEEGVGDRQLMGVARYNVDGTLDGSFGTGGIAMADFGRNVMVYSIALAPGGKIVVGGTVDTYDEGTGMYSSDFALARFTAAGVLDETFDGDGMDTTDFGGHYDEIHAVAVQGDGKILAVGVSYKDYGQTTDFFLARYNLDGTLDGSFGTQGVVTTDFFGYDDFPVDMTLQADGKIVVAGGVNHPDPATPEDYRYEFGVARYNSNGSLDPRFGTGGKASTTTGLATGGAYLAIQADGKILVGGTVLTPGEYNDNFAVTRFTSVGRLDNTFGTGGMVITDLGTEQDYGGPIALQSDGKILLAGEYSAYDEQTGYTRDYFALVRYTPSGVLDNTFDGDGKASFTFAGESSCYTAAWFNGRMYMGGYLYPENTFESALLVAVKAGPVAPSKSVVTIDDATVTEGGTASVVVHLNTTSHPALTINFATQDGSASSKGRTADYKALKGAVTIPDGSNMATINILTNRDAVSEPSGETFTVNLSLSRRMADLATIEDGSATVTINDEIGLLSNEITRAATVPDLPQEGLAANAYPNPSAGFFTLQLQSASSAPVIMKVTDAAGRVVETQSALAANSRIQFGQNYRPGVYYAHIQQGSATLTLKLVKQAH